MSSLNWTPSYLNSNNDNKMKPSKRITPKPKKKTWFCFKLKNEIDALRYHLIQPFGRPADVCMAFLFKFNKNSRDKPHKPYNHLRVSQFSTSSQFNIQYLAWWCFWVPLFVSFSAGILILAKVNECDDECDEWWTCAFFIF